MRRVLFIFGDLSDGDIEWLAAAGEKKTFPKGSVLVEQGKLITEIYILLDGQLSVKVASRSKSVTIKLAGRDGLFAAMIARQMV